MSTGDNAALEGAELAFCRYALDFLRKPKNNHFVTPFLEPVDLEANPGYLEKIAHPMDLSTMNDKVENGGYSSVEEFQSDFDLMLQNCVNFFAKTSTIHGKACDFLQELPGLWSRKNSWIRKYSAKLPAAAAAAAAAAPEAKNSLGSVATQNGAKSKGKEKMKDTVRDASEDTRNNPIEMKMPLRSMRSAKRKASPEVEAVTKRPRTRSLEFTEEQEGAGEEDDEVKRARAEEEEEGQEDQEEQEDRSNILDPDTEEAIEREAYDQVNQVVQGRLPDLDLEGHEFLQYALLSSPRVIQAARETLAERAKQNIETTVTQPGEHVRATLSEMLQEEVDAMTREMTRQLQHTLEQLRRG